MVKLDFHPCDYAGDFECLVDLHMLFSSVPEEKYDLWLKAYDTSCRETEHEIELNDAGYAFECYVWVTTTYTLRRSEPLFNAPAKSKEEAERMLTEVFGKIASDYPMIEAMMKED